MSDHTDNRARYHVARRLHRAIGPIAGAMILDAADFVTFGPLGLYAGALVGVTVGWWVTGFYRFSQSSRLFWAVMAAVYCTVPMTELLPIATVMSATARFFDDPGGAAEPVDAGVARAVPDEEVSEPKSDSVPDPRAPDPDGT
jgi:hypothetical protein